MMAINRYRLRHLANQGHRGARRASRLLERPDRLLGVILIGNNLVNFAAASVATVIALETFGDRAIAAATVICSLVFLIFSEVMPKTISAAYPEKIGLRSSYILTVLLWVLYPVVWVVNGVSNSILWLCGLRQDQIGEDSLTREELRTVVYEGAQIAAHPQNMLLSILDLEKVTVEDIMVPRADIFGVDINDDLDDIVAQLRSAQHTRLPVYRDDIDKIVGVLHLRNVIRFLGRDELSKEALLEVTEAPYFVPENTPLQLQLVNFQQARERTALVVDEYGDIQGIVTIEDILEEIVGEFTTDLAGINVEIHPQEDGSYLIEGSAHVRLINRQLGWNLPQDGPKTLSGVIIERLETIPEANVCIKLGNYRVEIVQIQDNMIRTAKVSVAPELF